VKKMVTRAMRRKYPDLYIDEKNGLWTIDENEDIS
jgi:hypothetical protein